MTQKKITDLQLRDDADDTCNFPVDDSVQSWRVTLAQIRAAILPDAVITEAKLAAAVIAKLLPALGWAEAQLASAVQTKLNAFKPIYARYHASTSFTTNGSSHANFDVEQIDTHDAVTTGSSWVFTAPRAGYYIVSVHALRASGTTGPLFLRTTGASATPSHWLSNSAVGGSNELSGTSLVWIPLGGTIYVDNGSGSDTGYASSTEENWISISSVS
jgi:hypothetical protein